MEQLITFRKNSESLSINEYQKFINEIFGQDKDNQNLLSEIMFSYFYQQLLHPETAEQKPLTISMINGRIKTIMDQRLDIAKKKKETCNSENNDQESLGSGRGSEHALSLNNMASPIIQSISEYLPFKSYSSLECSSRNIFIALRTPSMLQEFDPIITASNPSFFSRQLKIHRRIKTLIVSVKNVYSIKLNPSYHLNKLIIHSTLKPSDFDYFLQNNTFNWSNIKYLDLYCYGQKWTEPLLFSILQKCINLIFLEFRQEVDLNENNIQLLPRITNMKHMQNLLGLALDIQSAPMDPVISFCSDSLQSLHLTCCAELALWDDSSIIFRNLKELHLVLPEDLIKINRLIEAVPKLERISLVYEDNFLYHVEPNVDIVETFTKLFELESLAYFHLQSMGDLFDVVADILKDCLVNIHKSTLKIHLVFGDPYTDYAKDLKLEQDDICIQLDKLVKCLNGCSDDFMLICWFRLKLSDDKDILKVLNEFLNEMKEIYFVHSEISHHQQRVIIANKNNKFDGFAERWIMFCDHGNCNSRFGHYGPFCNSSSWRAYHNNFQ